MSGEWIQLLPDPSQYSDDFNGYRFTREGNARMVVNTKPHLPLPVSLEFDRTRPVGQIVDVRLDGDGGVSGLFSWTDTTWERGARVSKRLAAEWVIGCTAPVGGEHIGDVLTGGSVTRSNAPSPWDKRLGEIRH